MKRRFSFTRILSFVFLILLMGGGIFLSCDIITSPGNGSNSESESKQTAWEGAKEFDTWETNVSIPAEKFKDVSEGSRLIFSITEIASAEYHNIKIYENTTGKWQALSSGNIDGAELGSGSDAAFKPTSNTVTYTLTASDATALKSKRTDYSRLRRETDKS